MFILNAVYADVDPIDSPIDTKYCVMYGSKSAHVAIYNYVSYTCFHCAKLIKEEQENSVLSNLIKQKKVAVGICHYPLDRVAFHVASKVACYRHNKATHRHLRMFINNIFSHQNEMFSAYKKDSGVGVTLTSLVDRQAIDIDQNIIDKCKDSTPYNKIISDNMVALNEMINKKEFSAPVVFLWSANTSECAGNCDNTGIKIINEPSSENVMKVLGRMIGGFSKKKAS